MNTSSSQQTKFAPAARLPLVDVQLQANLLRGYPLIDPLLDTLPMGIVIVNAQRQIVRANQQFRELVNSGDLHSVTGRRPGEVLGCSHAADMPAGCGTSVHCSVCGVTKALLEARQDQQFSGEGQLIVLKEGRPVAMSLRLWSRPFVFGEQEFILLSVVDTSQESRRRILERTFFHDITNTVTSIAGQAELMERFGSSQAEHLVQLAGYVIESSQHLIDEIRAHRQLVAAEDGDLAVDPEPLSSTELLTMVRNMYRAQPLSDHRQIQIAPDSPTLIFFSDRALLIRVLGNMLKNALEASEPGDTITLGCAEMTGYIRFWVHNRQVIPPKNRLQIFQRSFSTKGEHRGIGTYSMKLLTEGYLNGTISFQSSAEKGTTFTAAFPIKWPSQGQGMSSGLP